MTYQHPIGVWFPSKNIIFGWVIGYIVGLLNATLSVDVCFGSSGATATAPRKKSGWRSANEPWRSIPRRGEMAHRPVLPGGFP